MKIPQRLTKWLQLKAEEAKKSKLDINAVLLAGVGLLLAMQLAPIAEGARLKNQCVAQWRRQLANNDYYKKPRMLSQHLIRICLNVN